MYELNLETTFSAAHHLSNPYTKVCQNIHGHSWRVQVKIKTSELIDGMVIDFKKIKEIINQLDHKDLNEVLDFDPTAENIAHWLHQEVTKEIKRPEGIVVDISITVFEADKASITYY